MRKIIAAMQMSLDGYIEGSNGELDWVEPWDDSYDGLYSEIDTCILGRGMYPVYEQYWRAILADPKAVLAFSGKVATNDEIEYAHFADKTPHIVLSKILQNVDWEITRIVRDVEEIRSLKQQSGKHIYAVGGATLVSSLMNLGLLDELRLVVHPIVLGGGKALFKDVKVRQVLTLIAVKSLKEGQVNLSYSVQKADVVN